MLRDEDVKAEHSHSAMGQCSLVGGAKAQRRTYAKPTAERLLIGSRTAGKAYTGVLEYNYSNAPS